MLRRERAVALLPFFRSVETFGKWIRCKIPSLEPILPSVLQISRNSRRWKTFPRRISFFPVNTFKVTLCHSLRFIPLNLSIFGPSKIEQKSKALLGLHFSNESECAAFTSELWRVVLWMLENGDEAFDSSRKDEMVIKLSNMHTSGVEKILGKERTEEVKREILEILEKESLEDLWDEVLINYAAMRQNENPEEEKENKSIPESLDIIVRTADLKLTFDKEVKNLVAEYPFSLSETFEFADTVEKDFVAIAKKYNFPESGPSRARGIVQKLIVARYIPHASDLLAGSKEVEEMFEALKWADGFPPGTSEKEFYEQLELQTFSETQKKAIGELVRIKAPFV